MSDEKKRHIFHNMVNCSKFCTIPECKCSCHEPYRKLRAESHPPAESQCPTCGSASKTRRNLIDCGPGIRTCPDKWHGHKEFWGVADSSPKQPASAREPVGQPQCSTAVHKAMARFTKRYEEVKAEQQGEK